MKTINMAAVLEALTAAGVDAVFDSATLCVRRTDPATDTLVNYVDVGPLSLDEETDEYLADKWTKITPKTGLSVRVSDVGLDTPAALATTLATMVSK